MLAYTHHLFFNFSLQGWYIKLLVVHWLITHFKTYRCEGSFISFILLGGSYLIFSLSLFELISTWKAELNLLKHWISWRWQCQPFLLVCPLLFPAGLGVWQFPFLSQSWFSPALAGKLPLVPGVMIHMLETIFSVPAKMGIHIYPVFPLNTSFSLTAFCFKYSITFTSSSFSCFCFCPFWNWIA